MESFNFIPAQSETFAELLEKYTDTRKEHSTARKNMARDEFHIEIRLLVLALRDLFEHRNATSLLSFAKAKPQASMREAYRKAVPNAVFKIKGKGFEIAFRTDEGLEGTLAQVPAICDSDILDVIKESYVASLARLDPRTESWKETFEPKKTDAEKRAALVKAIAKLMKTQGLSVSDMQGLVGDADRQNKGE